jgi:hypothetical protein
MYIYMTYLLVSRPDSLKRRVYMYSINIFDVTHVTDSRPTVIDLFKCATMTTATVIRRYNTARDGVIVAISLNKYIMHKYNILSAACTYT